MIPAPAARAVGVALLVSILGCSHRPNEPRPGIRVSGRAAPLRLLLEQLGSLAETPLGKLALEARQRIDACHGDFEGATAEPSLTAIARGLQCRADEESEELRQLRGDDDFALVAVLPGGRLAGHGRLDAEGSTTITLELTGAAEEGPAAMLLPRPRGDLGPTIFNRDALILGRFAADKGLDFASSVKADGAVDRLFRLKNQVFSNLILSGVWEVAVYPPAARDQALPIAVALEVTSPKAAAAAMDAFLDDVQSTWKLARRPFTLGEATGECLDALRILPGLEPCWVLTEKALAVGWNAAALERALGGPGSSEMADESRLVVELEDFPPAEIELSRAVYGASATLDPTVYPWRRAIFSGHRDDQRDGQAYLFTVQLIAQPKSEPPQASP